MTQGQPPETDVRELVERIVRALVDRPESIRVVETVGPRMTVFEVQMDDPRMIRQVIGRDGLYAVAIRRILVAISGKHHRSYILEGIE